MEKIIPVAVLALLTLSTFTAGASSENKSVVASSEHAVELKNQLALGESYRDQGSYELATKEFEAVLVAAEKNGDKLTQAMAGAALGYNYYLSRNESKAKAILEQTAVRAKALNSPGLSALIDDYLGMLYVSLDLPARAVGSFEQALKNAELAKNPDLILGIRVNKASVEPKACNRLSQLDQISNEVLTLNNQVLKTKLLLTIGEQLLAIPPGSLKDVEKEALVKNTYKTLNDAYLLADAGKQVRLRSQAEGYLGQLYAQQKRNQDALLWLDKAIADAQEINAADLSMQWELQSAKVLHAEGASEATTNAYKRAVKHLTAVRSSLPNTLHNGQSAIKTIVDPIYRGLSDQLLLQATKTTDTESKQKLLHEAIESMETIKQNELEEFFKDRCLIDEDTVTNLNKINLPGIGIVYPVILPDRVELLFRDGAGTQIEQKTIAVNAEEVNDNANEMSQFLRTGQGNYRNASRKLYDWLFKSYDSSLKAKGIKTLVYVPDGVLRQVPFSALLNGKHFIVEDYTIVTLPGLNLKNKITNTGKSSRALIAALSKPDGGSIDELLRSPVQQSELGERGGVNASDLSKAEEPLEDVAKTKRANLVDDLSLPGVNDEVKSLQTSVDNKTMLNEGFTSGELKDSVASGEYSIVHVASHGYFGKSAEDSFVMAYDRNLKLGEFKGLLSDEKLKNNPIDLLTLSACQTAEGDDKALLGFSGMAIKTNAQSAIGTLWSVDDKATASFMDAFYMNLTKLPKAQALRQAQLTLLSKKEYKHPHYWAPFILVGNW